MPTEVYQPVYCPSQRVHLPQPVCGTGTLLSGTPACHSTVPSVPVRPVTASDINPSSAGLEGDALLSHLRQRALTVCLGSMNYSEIMPEIARRLGATHADAAQIGLQIQTSASEIQALLTGRTNYVTMPNGIAGEFNRVVTFSVPESAGSLSLDAYYFTEPSAVTSGWNARLSFNPTNTDSQRFGRFHEVHVRREGGQIHYTIALSHNFVGALRIGVGGNTYLVHSHDHRPAPPASPLVVRPPEQPGEELNDQPLSAPRLDPPATGNDALTANVSATPVLPPMNSTENELRSDSRPGLSADGPAPTQLAMDAPLPPPQLEEGAPHSTVQSGGNGQSGVRDPGPVLASNTPQLDPAPSGGDQVAAVAPPPLPESDGTGSTPLSSGALPQILTPGSGWLVGLFAPFPIPLPSVDQPTPRDGSSVAQLPPPLPLEDGGNLQSLSGGGGGADSDSPLVSSVTPVVAARLSWRGLNVDLPTYTPPSVSMNPDNTLRARAYAALGNFFAPLMHDPVDRATGALPQTDAAQAFVGDTLDACYWLPTRGFSALQAYFNSSAPQDRNSIDATHLLSTAIANETSDAEAGRGTRWGVARRLTDMSAFLETLNGDARTNLSDVRLRLLGLARPLMFGARYMDAIQQAEAAAANQAPATLLPALVRPAEHNPFTITLQGAFRSIFGERPIPTHHLWNQLTTSLGRLDGNAIEHVHQWTMQDILTLRSLLQDARAARRDPAFLASFNASRVATVQTALAGVLPTGSSTAHGPTEAYLTSLFGAEAVTAHRTEIRRLIGTLSTENSPARRTEVAGQILAPFRDQMSFGEAQLTQLDRALDATDAYINRLRVLLRAQTVAENTDLQLGRFLMLLPDTGGAVPEGARNPSNAAFEERLTAALDALESEYAMLGGTSVGGSYATSRRAILNQYLQGIRAHLTNRDRPWSEFLEGTPARDALRRRLDRATPATREAATLPPDPVLIFERMHTVVPLVGSVR